ncbi:MAG TPA: hypothetical protein VK781_06665 [Solirubrobacteraceae bacterium]|nr:hypothetical protein [Solirubrobacteraceae bacterium]
MILADGSLAQYIDLDGRARELVAIPGHGGSVLVVDRDAATLCDRRLIAHLAADEPRENADLVGRQYIEDTDGRWCRQVCPEDLQIVPLEPVIPGKSTELDAGEVCLGNGSGDSYRLRPHSLKRSTPHLRWCRRSAESEGSDWEEVRLRDVVAKLESYEPVRGLTERAIARHQHDPSVLVARLRCELDRLCTSPIVLNRCLREAVLDAVDRRGMSMSEIALRCGVSKRDRRGKVSGETSWLARRIGIMPEGGETTATPWIHSEVLAVIARDGLGISPREVELQ